MVLRDAPGPPRPSRRTLHRWIDYDIRHASGERAYPPAPTRRLSPPRAAGYHGPPRAGLPRRRGASPMPAQKTVLLVDDDTDIIESMRTVLEGRGYRVMVARDGNAGLTVAERENPDLIVLDMMMPKKSGFLVL